MGVITFDAISEILEAEKESGMPTMLPENFSLDISEYIQKKEKIGRGDTESIISKVEKIFRIRLKKITDSALRSMGDADIEPPPNMIPEEAEIFEMLKNGLFRFSESIIPERCSSETADEYEFAENTEAFVGTDLKTYGPFLKGDTAHIPKENAELLIKEGKIKIRASGADR